ncbi:unnamed protein product [Dibothriocephalus latus]|uniref:GAT domain-containing protein n=1 Tax=Dibothriocephalus latus TaxID=60516 RepID=A0A3P6VBC4_DIBLA|nr:unnamed protein product [Dibothriocephalus latus]
MQRKSMTSSVDITAEAETNLANLVNVNDELLQCIDNYQQAIRRKKGFAQKPAAPDDRSTQLMQVIRQNLDLVALDLPVFKAMVRDLAATPPDDATLRQLNEFRDRLDGLHRRRGAYVRTLSGDVDPKLGNIKDKEAALAELIRVKDEIQDKIQQF